MNSRILPARWAREVNSPRRSSRRWRMEKRSLHVQPGGVHRGAGDVETGAGGQPCPGGPGGVGRPVVHDQVDVQVAGMAWPMRARNAQKVAESLQVMIWPVTTFIAAIR